MIYMKKNSLHCWDQAAVETTTLRIIAGFEEPSGGRVLFNGIEISKLPPYKREVNTVFQKYALFPHLNVAENIGFGLNLKKVDKTVVAQKVERMLKMVGLANPKREMSLFFQVVSSSELPLPAPLSMSRRCFSLTNR